MLKKKVYNVGGSVRDSLLGIDSSDIDLVAVGYSAKDFSHLELVGKDFPVFLNEKGQELALARIERKISDGYNGFSTITENVSIEDDLKRRDLTINSIAYDSDTNTYIDPYNGKEDLKNKILRHTSSAFKEDPLRVLRIARFQAKFPCFSIAKETKEFVKEMKNELGFLQKDRVYKEIQKVLLLDNSEVFFETLLELEVLDVLFPNIYNLSKCIENSIYHQEENVFVHTMMVLKELKGESNLLKLSAIYHDIAKPIMYEKTLGKNAGGHDNIKQVKPLIDMQVPSKLQKNMLFIIKNHIKIYGLHKMKEKTIATFYESFARNRELFVALLRFSKADSQGRIGETTRQLNEVLLLDIFDEISSYSPLPWIKKQNADIKGEVIKQHIHNINIQIVKKHMT